jgi:hypothetical protein
MGKGRPGRKADNLTDICEPIVYKMWEPQSLTTLWASTACYRDTFTNTIYEIRGSLSLKVSMKIACFLGRLRVIW